MSEMNEFVSIVAASRLDVADKARIIRLVQLLEKPAAEMTPDELAAARIAAGLSVGQAALLIGVPWGDVGDWERGFHPLMSPELFRRIDKAYGTGGRLKEAL